MSQMKGNGRNAYLQLGFSVVEIYLMPIFNRTSSHFQALLNPIALHLCASVAKGLIHFCFSNSLIKRRLP